MRTTLDECVKLGTIIASKINKSKGPTIVVLPMKGWSEYDKEGGVNTMDYYGNATGQTWYDAEADAGFVEALEDHTDGSKSNIEIIRVDCHINDMRVARLSASLLDDMIRGIWTKGKRYD